MSKAAPQLTEDELTKIFPALQNTELVIIDEPRRRTIEAALREHNLKPEAVTEIYSGPDIEPVKLDGAEFWVMHVDGEGFEVHIYYNPHGWQSELLWTADRSGKKGVYHSAK